MINPEKRKKRYRGLLKGEEICQLARDISHGKGDEITSIDLVNQCNSCKFLTLIMAFKSL